MGFVTKALDRAERELDPAGRRHIVAGGDTAYPTAEWYVLKCSGLDFSEDNSGGQLENLTLAFMERIQSQAKAETESAKTISNYLNSLDPEERETLALDIIEKQSIDECESSDDLLHSIEFCLGNREDYACYLMWAECTLVPILTQIIEHSMTSE